MRKLLLFALLLFAFAKCTQKKTDEPQMTIPAGMSIRSQITSHMSYDNLPTDDLTYIPPSMAEVTIYTTFEGISLQSHSYQIIIANSQGQHACPQDPAFEFTSEGNVQNVWTRITASKCLSQPDEYTIKIYLDGNWVLAKKIKVLSDEEMKSGKYEAYWNKDKYMEAFPAAKTKLKGEWVVRTLLSDSRSLSKLFVVPFKGYNRIFVVVQEDQNYSVQEQTNYGLQPVVALEGGDQNEPWFIRYKVVDQSLYIYNSKNKASYDLNSGQLQTNVELPFNVAPDDGFTSRDNKHIISRGGLLDGKPLFDQQTCLGAEVSWVSWSEDGARLYFEAGCQADGESGLYQRNLRTGQSQRMMKDFDWLSSPFYFENNGSEFIAFLENEEGQPTKIKVATEHQFYKELGFGPNFYWDRVFGLPIADQAMEGAYLKVDFLPAPQDYLAYSYSDEMGLASKEGVIRLLGKVSDGPLAGKELYMMKDDEFFEDKGILSSVYNTVEHEYLIRNGEEMVIINARGQKQEMFLITDMDGKKQKSTLFSGVTKMVRYENQFIAGLHAAPLLDLPNSSVKLTREGIVSEPGNKSDYRKIFDHPIEGEIYVRQPDDGSFWRFNGDQTATLYQYQIDFAPTINGTSVALDEYVPFTNHDCAGSPLDFAHILTPDPSRLKQISSAGETELLFGFTSDQDEILRAEYDQLNTAYNEYSEGGFKSYKEFLQTQPLFLWKDPFGRYVRFVRKEYLRPANCEPILYLYPETTTDVSVDLGDKINVIASRPAFNTQWNVRAEKDGRFVDLATTKQHDRIFYEGISDFLPPLEKGFVIAAAELSSFFDEKLLMLGLNAKETEDFKKAWLKEMKAAPFYFVGFYEKKVIDKYAPLNIEPQPETIIRILMDYRPLQEKINVTEPDLIAPKRKGFTVVEWGGLKR